LKESAKYPSDFVSLAQSGELILITETDKQFYVLSQKYPSQPIPLLPFASQIAMKYRWDSGIAITSARRQLVCSRSIPIPARRRQIHSPVRERWVDGRRRTRFHPAKGALGRAR